MLATKHRVPRQYIDYILKKGDSFTSKLFIIRLKENTQHFCRYRVIISRKVDLKAVKRNHLRRQIYEAIRINLMDTAKSACAQTSLRASNVSEAKSYPQKNHFDLILIVKKNAMKASFAELEADIKTNIINHHYGKIQ